MILRIVIVLLVVGALYISYVNEIFSNGIEQQILAATTNDSYPFIPNRIALMYLEHGPEERMEGETPSIPFTVAGCGLSKSFISCEKIKNVVSILHSRGEDIEEYHDGMTALHAAILFKEKVMVLHLLELGANTEAKVKEQSKKYAGMTAIQLAEYQVDKGGEVELEIAAILKNIQ